MAIAEDIYARCARCLCDAAELARALTVGKTVVPTDVTARRAAADIAADTTFGLLRQAFITPVDREDLWTLWGCAEAVLRAVEDTALSLYCAGRGLPSECVSAMQQLAECCESPVVAIESRLKTEALTTAVQTIRQAVHRCYETERAVFANATARRTCQSMLIGAAACERVVAQLRYMILKNT